MFRQCQPYRHPGRIAAALILAFCASAALAGPTARFDIPAQPLSSALRTLATQSGVQLVFTPETVGSAKGMALQGEMSVEAALEQLLAGSGLVFQFTDSKSVVIKLAPAEKPTQLPPIEIRSAAEAGSAYYRPIASTATKTDTPLMQTPMTVEVLPKTMLEEMGVANTGLADVVKYSGVTTQGQGTSMGGMGTETLSFRGFLTSTTLWNGFRVEDFDSTGGLTTGNVWMGNVASVELLKGPSSTLYGRAEPGGAVNVLTNRPQESPRTTVTAGIGSWSDRWIAFDTTGSANEDKTLLYRLHVSEEGSDTWFRWNGKTNSKGIAPALEWRLTPQTTLSYEGLYRTTEGYSAGTAIPWNTATGEMIQVDSSNTFMPDATQSTKLNRSTLGLTHRFDEDWSISLKYMHDVARTPMAQYVWLGSATFPATAGVLTVAIQNGWSVYDLTTDATLLDVTGHVSALGIRHTILLGADYYKKSGHSRGGYDWSGTQTTNFFNPTPPDWNIPQQYTTERSNREISIYMQDQIELPGNWHVLLGGRYQRLEEDFTFNSSAYPHDTRRTFLPRLGLLWQAFPWLSTYYSYSENLGSNMGRQSYTGELLKPEFSKQHELGVKGEWMDGRLSALFSVFDLTKTNVALTDTTHPGFSISAGEVRSKGYEFNLQGEVTNNWNVLVNYSQANPVITGDIPAGEDPETGMTLPMVSKRTLGIWTSYRLPQEALRGWKIGGGYNWASAPTPYRVQPFPTSSYKTVSAFASYETKVAGHKTTVQLNVDNLLNEKYQYMAYDPGNSGIWNVSWGTPRQARLSLRTEF